MKVYNEHNDNKLTQDLLNCLDKFREKRGFDSKSYIEEKVNIINKYFTKSGLDTAIVAVSGGIDSAATLALIIKASKEKDSNIKKVMLKVRLNQLKIQHQKKLRRYVKHF